jgi:hypothetical protein
VIDDVPQRRVAGEAKVDDPQLFTAPLRHGHGAGVRLQISPGVPGAAG